MFLSLQQGDSPAKATRTGKRKQEKKNQMAKIQTYYRPLKLQQLDLHDEVKAQRTIDSYLGILSHTASYRMAQSIGLSKPLTA